MKILFISVFCVGLTNLAMAEKEHENPLPRLHKDAEIHKIAAEFGVKKIHKSGTLLELSNKNKMQIEKGKSISWRKIFGHYGLQESKLIDIEGLSAQSVSLARYRVSHSYDLVIYAQNSDPVGEGLIKITSIFFVPHKEGVYGADFNSGPTTWKKIQFANSADN